MLKVGLFLGFQSSSFEKALAEMDSHFKELCISSQPDSYLTPIVLDGVSYLGKFLGEMVYVSELELLEKNIKSILQKIFPNFQYQDVSLEILVVPVPN